MMPRRYDLGKRADQMDATRERIVSAALALYRDEGLSAATVPAIARRADVAPATVRNHFPNTEQLTAAVAEAVLVELRIPGPEIFEGLETIEERVRHLGEALAEFYGRGQVWWRVYTTDPGLRTAWSQAEAAFAQRLEGLMRAALGPLGDDELAVAVVSTTVGPPLHYAIVGRGLSPSTAVDVGIRLAVPWLEARAATLRKSHRTPRSR
jgi:AcrR family transcriptional regulator